MRKNIPMKLKKVLKELKLDKFISFAYNDSIII